LEPYGKSIFAWIPRTNATPFSPLTDLSLANEKMTRVDSVTLDERGEGTSQQQRQVRNILYVETIGNDGMEGRLNS